MSITRRRIMVSISDEAFADIVAKSTCYADVVRALGLRVGPSYNTVKRRVACQGLSIAHFTPWHSAHRAKVSEKQAIPLSEILVVGRAYNSNQLKKRLIKEGLVAYRCVACDNTGEWQQKPLTLQLDHINGNHVDNRLENLRILCPNCHSQTPTSGGGKPHDAISYCPDCNEPFGGHGKRCAACATRYQKKHAKTLWPTEKVLQTMVWEAPLHEVAKRLGCSRTGLAKHCRKLTLSLPPCGYWLQYRPGYNPSDRTESELTITPSAKA